MIVVSELDVLIGKYWNDILEYRRWLHAHPELSGQEERTASYIAEVLREIGFNPVEHIGGYGVSVLIKGSDAGRCVGIRADFDALPVLELTGLPFESRNPGVMHACGHDMHTAMLLGAAHILNDLRDRFDGTIKLIFQPSEEKADQDGRTGAVRMIDAGVLTDPPVDVMIGQHLDAELPTGNIVFKSGTMTAASDRFDIVIYGKGSHAAKPDQGVDAIAIGVQVVCALQSIVSRNISPLDSAVVTVGTVSGGTASNVIADKFEITGTCRTHREDTRNMIERRMEGIVRGISEAMGAECEFKYNRGNSAVVNDPKIYSIVHEAACSAIGQEHIIQLLEPSMGSEDFSCYAQKIPGCFYRLGCLKEGAETIPLHSGRFNPDEECMKTGVVVMVSSALQVLKMK